MHQFSKCSQFNIMLDTTSEASELSCKLAIIKKSIAVLFFYNIDK